MTDLHKKQLRRIGIFMGVGTFLLLGGWVLANSALGIELVTTCRLAGLTVMVLLISCVVTPLFLDHPFEQKIRGWLIYWFVTSLAFDFLWEVPLWTIPAIHEAAHTVENLPWAIIWWAYTLADTLYTEVTPLMVAFEIWWLLGNLIGLAGLLKLRSGKDDAHAYVLLGVCGALQCYNATVYLFVGGYVDHFETIAPDAMGQAIYWGLNGFWGVASCCASILAFKLLLANRAEPSTT